MRARLQPDELGQFLAQALVGAAEDPGCFGMVVAGVSHTGRCEAHCVGGRNAGEDRDADDDVVRAGSFLGSLRARRPPGSARQ